MERLNLLYLKVIKELAKEALRRKVEADKKYETLKQNHATASAQARSFKEKIYAFRS